MDSEAEHNVPAESNRYDISLGCKANCPGPRRL